MQKLLKAAYRLLLLNAVAWLIGRYLGARLSSGDETSEVFTLATIYGGGSFSGRAEALRSGRARVLMGAVTLDLRQARLDAAGAHLSVAVTMGGAMIRVSDEWRVAVDEDLRAAQLHVDVTPPDALPADAPQLHIRVVGRGGGVTITSAPSRLAA